MDLNHLMRKMDEYGKEVKYIKNDLFQTLSPYLITVLIHDSKEI